MYEVWYRKDLTDEEHCFMSYIPTIDLAERIARNLEDEFGVFARWVKE